MYHKLMLQDIMIAMYKIEFKNITCNKVLGSGSNAYYYAKSYSY